MNPTRLRADAAGNRARIIAAARTAIAAAGEVKLNAIARQAGVGQGTLYRHFPTREDLLAEVYREDVDELVAAAPVLLAASSRTNGMPEPGTCSRSSSTDCAGPTLPAAALSARSCVAATRTRWRGRSRNRARLAWAGDHLVRTGRPGAMRDVPPMPRRPAGLRRCRR